MFTFFYCIQKKTRFWSKVKTRQQNKDLNKLINIIIEYLQQEQRKSILYIQISMSQKEFEGDAGAPLPDFSGASNISLGTVAPALGIGGGGERQPDYLDYDQKGRGLVTTMFANAGLSYLIGIAGGGLYGLQKGISSTPSSKFKVQVNSVLNHCGRYGSKAGNSLGVFAVIYSLYEGLADKLEIDQMTGIDAISPPLAAGMTGITYYAPAGIRVAALAGTLGFGMVGATYVGYSMIGKPVGSYGYLFL